MIKFIRILFFLIVVKPLVFLLLGLNIYHRYRLPQKGPAIIVANHNSHLDTAILMSLFPVEMLKNLRPVAAADYFLRNRLLSWFSKNMIGIIPISRKKEPGVDPLANVHKALANRAIVIFYPEGTRGEPGHMAKIKSGIAYLAQHHADVPIVPIFIQGTGKALPKGEALLVPFVVDITVHEALHWNGDKEKFIKQLEEIFYPQNEKALQKSYV